MHSEFGTKDMSYRTNPFIVFGTGLFSGCVLSLIIVQSGSFIDIQYFVRMFLLDAFENVKKSKNEECLEDDSSHMVLPSSIDRNLHMNNSAYIYELNFSRKKLFSALGLWKVLRTNGFNVIIQSQSIRYRRELKLFQKYSIKSKIITWDDDKSAFFLESRFVSSKDGFILAVHHAKYKLVCFKSDRKAIIDCLPSAVLKAANQIPLHYNNPPPSQFIDTWEAANNISSRELNPRKTIKSKEI